MKDGDATIDDEIIVIDSDDELFTLHPCDKKLCKSNPNCLNYLSNPWESESDGDSTLILSIQVD